MLMSQSEIEPRLFVTVDNQLATDEGVNAEEIVRGQLCCSHSECEPRLFHTVDNQLATDE